MRTRLLPFVALAFVLGLMSCTPNDRPQDTASLPTSASESDQKEAVEALVEHQAQAIQANDMAVLDSLWSGADYVHVFEQGGVDSSWAAYRDHHLKPELDAFEDLAFRHEEVQVRVNGAMALATGRYVLTAHYEDRDIESQGVFSTVLERQDDTWRIIHTHLSRRPRR